MQAIKHAIETWQTEIISMSFGSEDMSWEIRDAIEEALKRNVILLAAAGNSGNRRDIPYPASEEGVSRSLQPIRLDTRRTSAPRPVTTTDITATSSLVVGWCQPGRRAYWRKLRAKSSRFSATATRTDMNTRKMNAIYGPSCPGRRSPRLLPRPWWLLYISVLRRERVTRVAGLA